MSTKAIVNEIELAGIRYIRKDLAKSNFLDKFVVIRTYSAGVHIGILSYHEGKEVVLKNSIRIWQWAGAFSLSELATRGTKEPGKCRFAVEVPEILLTETIEIIPISKEAEENLKKVKTWNP